MSSFCSSWPSGADALRNVDATNTPPGRSTLLISATCRRNRQEVFPSTHIKPVILYSAESTTCSSELPWGWASGGELRLHAIMVEESWRVLKGNNAQLRWGWASSGERRPHAGLRLTLWQKVACRRQPSAG